MTRFSFLMVCIYVYIRICVCIHIYTFWKVHFNSINFIFLNFYFAKKFNFVFLPLCCRGSLWPIPWKKYCPSLLNGMPLIWNAEEPLNLFYLSYIFVTYLMLKTQKLNTFKLKPCLKKNWAVLEPLAPPLIGPLWEGANTSEVLSLPSPTPPNPTP